MISSHFHIRNPLRGLNEDGGGGGFDCKFTLISSPLGGGVPPSLEHFAQRGALWINPCYYCWQTLHSETGSHWHQPNMES